jgi:DNA-binding CsgD family transcriptional regulator
MCRPGARIRIVHRGTIIRVAGAAPVGDLDSREEVVAGALIGRDGELALLRAFRQQAETEGAALLLVGEPGMGKTQLLDAIASATSAAGGRVLRAGGVEFEADVSFSALNQALLPLLGEFAQLGATHRDALNAALGFVAGAAPDRLVVSSATSALLRQVAAAQPVLVAVDDLQWLDRASAGVLGFIARRVAGSRVGFLGAARLGEASFFERSGLPEYELGPLDRESANSLLSARFPSLAPRVRERVLAEAEGNPLALLELPTALSGPQRAALTRLPTVLPLGRSLEGLFASRVSELPGPTRDLLLLTALDGTGDLRVLRAAHDTEQGLEDLAHAEEARLVHVDESSHRLVFRHPLIRSAVVQHSTHRQRRLAHAALAELLTDQPDRRAWHLAEAAIEPDESVAQLLEQAAHRILRRGDAVGAVSALTRASELSPSGTDRSRRLTDAAYIGADVTGGVRNVSQLLADARQADPQLGSSLPVAIAAAYALLNADGDIVTAHSLLVGAIKSRTEPYPADEPALIEALQTLLYVCLWALRADLWPPFHAALARLTGHTPAVLELRMAVQTRADPVRTATRPVLEQLDAALASLQDETDLVRIDRVIRAAIDVDRTSDCRATLWRLIGDGRDGGAVTAAIFAIMHLGITDFFTGDWDEAQQLADEGLTLCETYGYGLLAWPFRRTQALIAAARGDEHTARTLSDEMTEWAKPRRVGLIQVYAHHTRELAALGAGDFEHAYQQVTQISPPGVLPSHVGYALWVALDLVEAAVHTNRHTEAASHIAAMRDADIAAISPRLAVVATGSAAIAAPQDRATQLFEEAIAIPGAHHWPFELARVQLAYGEHLRRAGAVSESRPHLEAAREIFEHLGARPWATRASGELRATGQTKPRAHTHAAEQLTPQEREIAQLAAAGLTNKQIAERLFLSHRTVGAHLYRLFPKLGITSRAALRDALTSARPNDQSNQ